MEQNFAGIFPNVKVQPHWLETLEAAAEALPPLPLVMYRD